MIGALVVVFLQVTAAPAAAAPPEAPAVQEEASAQASAIPPGTMDCRFNRGTRVYTCTNSEGEVLRCRRERTLGSRFRTLVCLTYAEDQQIQRDSHTALDHQQRISTPGGG